MDFESVLNSEPEILNVESKPMVRLVNPNIGNTYVDTLGGVEYSFVPLKIFQVDLEKAEQFIQRAKETHNEQKQNSVIERRTFLALMDHEKFIVRDRANQFGKMVDGEVVTKSQPTKYPGLIRLDQESELKLFHSVIEEFTRNNKKSNLDLEIAKTKTNPEGELLPMSDPNWNEKTKIAYIERYGNKRPFMGERSKRDAIHTKQCMEAFDFYKGELMVAGTHFTVKTPDFFRPEGE